jgi:hypothetical protein
MTSDKARASVPKPQVPRTLELVRGSVVLGTIEVKPGDGDLPWRSGAFRPSAEFEAVRGLFARELQLLRDNTADDPAQWDDWEAAHAELHDPGLRLQARDKSYAADEILIHIEDSEAWWRSE